MGRTLGETHARAWVKSISWRILAIIVLGAISLLVTHSVLEMSLITLIYNLIQIFLYYFHERLWDKVGWGKIRHPLSDFKVNRELREEDKKIIERELRNLGYLD